ncbi:MAG: AraC family ligand binding domain-containing protein [Terriglobales bacterium]
MSPIRKEVIFARPGTEVVRLSIAAGNAVPAHASNVDVTAVVVHGAGQFFLDGNAIALQPGVVVDMRPHQQHSIQATTDLELVVLHYRLGAGDAAVHCGA